MDELFEFFFEIIAALFTTSMGRRILVVLIILTIVFFVYVYPDWAKKSETQELVTVEAKHMCHGTNEEYTAGNATDAWGLTLQYQSEEVADPLSTVCGVRSAGPDGLFDTNDDIVGMSRDLHKTEIVGKWMGDRAKKTVGSFIDGWRGNE